jgi:long-chain acyl-CoA synthetase
LSESSPIITVSDERRFRRGSVGLPIPGVEVSISSDGEILTRGPHVMVGYYKNEAATRDVIRDGWLHTGDLGRIDDDGFVYITGRKKELIVTSGGKNIAPVMLEQLLTEDPLILQAMVVGDDRNYLTALIVPDEAQLRAQLSSDATWTDVVGDHETKQLVADRVHARLRTVSRYEQIAKCSLLPDPFSIENGMLTPKLSLRRREIAAAYAAEIASMYESD